jgi:hypothetical protein
MKSSFVAFLASVCSVHALPPAPFYTLYGTVRDGVGQIVEVQGARIILLKDGVEIGRTPINSSLQPDQNYELRLRLDHARAATRLYSPEAVATQAGFSVRVEMNGQMFMPIQSSGNLTAGKGGERVRYDITIGEDSDGDGLPDAWEEWQLYQAGYPPLPSGRWDISLITPDGDLDGDGFSNLAEYLAGTYAAEPTSYFEVQIKEKGIGIARQFFRFTGKSYRLERSDSPASGTWTPVDFALTQGGVPAGFQRATDVGPLPIFVVPLDAQEFYRLTLQ